MIAASLLVLLALPAQSPEAQARFNRAVELQRSGSFAEAEREYRAVLRLAPDYAEAQANLGAVLARLDRYPEAVAAYERALRLAPNLAQVRLNLGIAHYRKGDFPKAAEALRTFLELSPDNAQARQLLGLALVESGRDAEAVDVLSEVLHAAPADPAALYGLGLATLRLQRAGVFAIIDRLDVTPGGKPAAHLLRGQALLGGHEFERAVAELDQAARLEPNLPRLDYSLGLTYFKLGRNAQALEAFTRELARNGSDFSTLYYLPYLHEAQENLAEARRYLERALALDRESAEGNALLGKILVKEGKPAEALGPLEAAVAKDPASADRHYLLARAYQQVGRKEDAAREFAEVQRLKKLELERDRARTPKP